MSELTDECDRFCRYVRRMIEAVVTVGIGEVCENILDLSQSYAGAREAVSYREFMGPPEPSISKRSRPRKSGCRKYGGGSHDESV